MLIIFDVDGTLIGGEAADWKCFGEAFLHVTGNRLEPDFWKSITEGTAKAIIQQALADHSPDDVVRIERAVCDRFLEGLKAAHASDVGTFSPMPGAALALEYLRAQDGIDVAIATGDWFDSISFKLSASGIDVSNYPMATATDCYARADIIRLAAQRAGRDLADAIYIGDGLWDFHATRKLGIPFLGVGKRHAEFVEAGVVHALQTLDAPEFTEWFLRFRGAGK